MMEIKNPLVETVWAFYQWLNEGMDCMLAQTKMDKIACRLNSTILQLLIKNQQLVYNCNYQLENTRKIPNTIK